MLLVGHASTLDACSRQLVSGSPRTRDDLAKIVHSVPYCSLATVQQCPPTEESTTDDPSDEANTKDRWKLVEPPVPPMTCSANLRFHWQTSLG